MLKVRRVCNLEIIKARNMGFCFGVKRAVNKADRAIKEIKNNGIYMLGEIIHNPQVIKEFTEKGVKIVNEVTQVPYNAYLISRAHGISLHEKKIAESRNIKLIDTTCPYVKKLHEITKLLRKENYHIAIFGDLDHPEIKSLLSYNTNNTAVIQSIDEIKDFLLEGNKKVALVSQTTKNTNDFNKIAIKMIDKVEELRIFRTICNSTTLRQSAVSELAKKVDIIIVVGGLNSANTARLAQISKKIGIKTYHIESENNIEEAWFKGIQKIGVTSGASTPDYVTESVIRRIKKIPQ